MTDRELIIKIIEECDTRKSGSYDLYGFVKIV
jgi:hypothetical protein